MIQGYYPVPFLLLLRWPCWRFRSLIYDIGSVQILDIIQGLGLKYSGAGLVFGVQGLVFRVQVQ